MAGDLRGGEALVADATSSLVEHPLRDFVLQEIHARPFQVMATPRLILHYGFTTTAADADRAREDLAERCRVLGLPEPAPDANQHIVQFGDVRLRWETRSEITIYSWDCDGAAATVPTSPEVLLHGFRQPGPLIVATRLDLVRDDRPTDEILAAFDPGSTAVSALRDGRAIAATDFRVRDGLTNILVVDRGLFSQEVGALVQRLIELETYRTMALLGLPEARRLQPQLARLEEGLRETTNKIGSSPGLNENRALLDRLTEMAAELESSAAESAFRFGASRAYAEIVGLRLASIREGMAEGYTRWSSFLQRRMAPAMRTCQTVENRQHDLSDRMARAANLLRTRIEVELEQQNRELLATMNRRAQLQFRLQQWVEGLSVAAVSYYVVGLVYYLAGGAGAFGWEIESRWVAAFAVIPVVLAIWFFVRRLRASHGGHEDDDGKHA